MASWADIPTHHLYALQKIKAIKADELSVVRAAGKIRQISSVGPSLETARCNALGPPVLSPFPRTASLV